MFRIVIDPGHGGTDPGALGNGLKEAEINLAVALRLEGLLRNNPNFSVKLTRTTNTTLTLAQRTRMSNAFNADLFLSIHCNAFQQTTGNGFEVFHTKGSIKGQKLAEHIEKAVLKNADLYQVNRGIKTAKFYVIRNTIAPAALVEMAFITNFTDSQILINYQNEFAQAFYEAICNYANVDCTTITAPTPTTKPQFNIEQSNFLINNKITPLTRILLNGKNFIELREFDRVGLLDINWNEEIKMPTISFKNKVFPTPKINQSIPGQFIVNGKVETLNRIFENNKNYVELREFARVGLLQVDYDAQRNLPIINSIHIKQTQPLQQNFQTPILGPPTATLEQAKKWAQIKNNNLEFINLCNIYFKLATQININPVVAIAQMAHETGFLYKVKSAAGLDASYHNPCGLKTTQGGGDFVATAHKRFDSWEEGVQAHLDHLALYAGANNYPRINTPDPRHFPYLKGTATTVEALSGKWAPSKTYHTHLLKFIKEIEAM